MEETPIDNPEKLWYRLFIGLCISFHKNRVLFWFTLILGIVLSLLSAIFSIALPLTPDNPHIKGTLIESILRYAPIILPYGFCFLLWTALASVASRLEVGFSDKELKRRYLRRMVRETEQFRITGLPTDLVVQSVELDKIVISLQFRLNEPLTDYPLTEVELRYYEDRRSRGVLTQEESRLLYSNRQSWLNPFNQDKITMTDLWNRFTQKEPVAIIQGFPGMGKSTLLTYFVLYMARCNLRLFYKHGYMPKLRPKLIPIYIHLGDYVRAYARARSETPNNSLSLRKYLAYTLEELHITGIAQFIINDCLRTGRCLVLLDGLEEVESQDIQRAIVAFIREYSDTYENTRHFNRFLITSRVAPHSRTYFPIAEDISGYPCYTIAELTKKQIEDFWPLWFLANIHHDTVPGIKRLFGRKKAIAEEASRLARDFYTTFKDQIGDLTERPLLLALLAVMQRKQMFPKQRIELYSIITNIMLETRKNAEGHSVLSEAEVIQRLGPLAFQMQEKGARTAHRSEVMMSFTDSPGTCEAEAFLNGLRFQGGFFVQRAGDYFGFFHHTFQKYITACHIAHHIFEKIKRGSDSEISEFVTKIYQSNELHEPLFLAASYKSSEDSTISKKIIQSLLVISQISQPGVKGQGYQVLLAAKCLLEAEVLITDPNHNDPNLDKSIAEHLLQVYEEAQRQQLTDTCREIEGIIILWLRNLPGEVHHRFPLLSAICEAVRDTNHCMRQCAMLTLLTAIAEHLLSCACASTVLNELIPLLLALAGLPSIGRYRPVTDLTATIDSEVAKLAQSTLLFMSQQKSIGLSLTEINQHLESQSNVPSTSGASLSGGPHSTVQ